MAFNRFLKPPAQPGAAPAPAPAPAAVTPDPLIGAPAQPPAAAVVPPPAPPAPAPAPPAATVTVTVPAPAARPSGLMIPRQTVAAVLSVIVQDTGGGSGELFPTLMQKGGNAGGTMAPSGLTPKEVANALPQGRQPVKGVFMAFRSIAQAWPVDFDHRKDGDRPTIDVAIGPNDSDTTALLRAGAENFQFCPKDAKTKWSAAAGGPGLLRPIFQILVYLPDFDDVIVVQAPPLLESWVKMGQQVAQFQDKDGGLAPFPVVCEPTTEPWYEDNNYHFVKLSLDAATGATAMAKYDAFVATVQSARPDLAESVMDWFNGADKPLNDAALAKLKQAANMTNPRKRRS